MGVAFAQFVSGVAEPHHHLPIPSPLCPLHGQFGLDLLALAFVRRFWLEKAATFGRWPGAAWCWEWALGGVGRCCNNQSGRGAGAGWSGIGGRSPARLQVGTQAPCIFSPVKEKAPGCGGASVTTPADGPASELRG